MVLFNALKYIKYSKVISIQIIDAGIPLAPKVNVAGAVKNGYCRKWLTKPISVADLVGKSYQQPVIHVVFDKAFPFKGTRVATRSQVYSIILKENRIVGGNPWGKNSFGFIVPIGQRKVVF